MITANDTPYSTSNPIVFKYSFVTGRGMLDINSNAFIVSLLTLVSSIQYLFAHIKSSLP